jgi:hypothetical protein
MYAERMIYYTVLSKCYTFNKDPDFSHKHQRHSQLQQNYFPEIEQREEEKDEEPVYEGGSVYKKPTFQRKLPPESQTFSANHAHRLANSLQNVRRYAFNKKNLFYYFCCCIKRRWKCFKDDIHTNHILYTKGKQKYLQDMDIMNIVSSLHQVRTLTNLLIDDRQAILAKFNKYRNVDHLDPDGGKPMQEVVKYKCSNYNSKHEHFSETIQELCSLYDGKELSEMDKRLFDQIDKGILEDERETKVYGDLGTHLNRKVKVR